MLGWLRYILLVTFVCAVVLVVVIVALNVRYRYGW